MTDALQSESHQRCLRIGDWILDPLAHELVQGELRRRIPKRLVRLLLALAEEPGRTLTREQLLATVWQRPLVGDEVLSRAVAELRQALDDDARAPRYVETLPKTGYRLCAAVSAVEPEPRSVAGEAAAAGPMTARRRRVPMFAAGAATLGLLLVGAVLFPGQPPESARWTPGSLALARPFLSESNWVRQPRYSRDGRWLVYVEEAAADGSTRVWMTSADGGNARPLELGPGRLSGPQLSPDSTQLAVLARHGGACEVRMITLPAGQPRRLGSCSNRHGTTVEWLDDQTLLHTADAGASGGAPLLRLDIGRGTAEALTTPLRLDVADSLPRVAPDGSIAFLRGPPQRQRVLLLQEGRQRVLVASEDRVTDLAWSVDGRQLLIGSNRGGHPMLMAVDPQSGEVEELGARGIGSFDISPHGMLLFEQRRYVANLRLYRPGTASRAITDSRRYDAYPALSPDGRQLAYVSNRDGNGSLWLQDPVGSGSERRLDLPIDGAWSRPSWTPDGSGLMVNRYDGDATVSAFKVEIDGDRHRPLDGPAASGTAVRLLPDGSVLYADTEEGRSSLWVQGRAAPPRKIAPDVLEFRTDGRWIAWQSRGSSGIQIVSHAHEPLGATAVLQQLPSGQPSVWTLVQGELVYLVSGDDQVLRLWRLPLPTGEPVPWLVVEHPPSDATLAVAPGFAYAIIGGIEKVEADLWLAPPAQLQQ